MSQMEVNIKCDNIKNNFSESGMTAGEFWSAFEKYCERESDKICSRRYNRYGRIKNVLTGIAAAAFAMSSFATVILAAIH